MSKGFTLFEVLIVMALIVILGLIGTLNLGGYKAIQALENDAEIIVAFIRDAQQRSITQENDSQWGINFTNPSAPDIGYSELFQGSVYPGIIHKKQLLHPNIEFTTPTRNNTADVVFKKLTGESADPVVVSVTIGISGYNCSSNPTKCRTITLESNGTIKY